jgi:hypothetical protein
MTSHNQPSERDGAPAPRLKGIVEFIQTLNANDPAIGYNRWPRYK